MKLNLLAITFWVCFGPVAAFPVSRGCQNKNFVTTGASLNALPTVSKTIESSDQSDDSALASRRQVLLSSGLLAALVLGPVEFSWADDSSSLDYRAVASDIAALVRNDPDKGPTMVRCISKFIKK